MTRGRGLTVAAAGCLAGLMTLGASAGCGGDDGPAGRPTVVAVTVQRCARPNAVHGVGVVVRDGLVVTAGHVVEGDLRRLELTAGGATVPAAVVALDRNRDLALVTADLGGAVGGEPVVAEAAGAVPSAATVVTPEREMGVTIDRHVTQVVDHATDGATYRREVVVFPPAVDAGTSGAPVLDADNRLVGIVVATLDDETYAVTAGEVSSLVAEHDDDHPGSGDVVVPPEVIECRP